MVDNLKCEVCGKKFQVVHTGKPTRKQLAEAELLQNGKNLICFDCEAEEIENKENQE